MRACPHLLSGSERSLHHRTNHSTACHLAAAIGYLGAHALGVFGFGGGGPWGRDWEERKTRETMDKEGGS
jgi:hypothetical protein